MPTIIWATFFEVLHFKICNDLSLLFKVNVLRRLAWLWYPDHQKLRMSTSLQKAIVSPVSFAVHWQVLLVRLQIHNGFRSFTSLQKVVVLIMSFVVH